MHGEGNAVARARVRVEHERDDNYRVSGDDRDDALPPRHAEVYETAGRVVRRNADQHADP